MFVQKVLNDFQRSKENNSNDAIFYANPRFVYHLDAGFRERLESLYRENIGKESIVLDLMSSWVSHLPEDINYKNIIGHGLNQQELKSNKRLDSFWVQDLNVSQKLPLETSSVDVCLMVAAWQYLQEPEAIAMELKRVVKKDGMLIISFSNRAFWEKAPRIWIEGNDNSRIKYVQKVLLSQGWSISEYIYEKYPSRKFLNFLSQNSDPFISIIAKN